MTFYINYFQKCSLWYFDTNYLNLYDF